MRPNMGKVNRDKACEICHVVARHQRQVDAARIHCLTHKIGDMRVLNMVANVLQAIRRETVDELVKQFDTPAYEQVLSD